MVSKFNEMGLQVGHIICKKHLFTYSERPLTETNQIEMINQNQDYNNNVIENENEFLNDQTETLDDQSITDATEIQTETSNISITAKTNESLKKRKIPAKKDSITLNFDRTKSTHKKCFVCNKEAGLVRFSEINDEGIIEVYIKTGILIAPGSRCCRNHLSENKHLLNDELQNLAIYKDEIELDHKKIEDLFKSFRSRDKKTSLFEKFGDYASMEDEDIKNTTGLSKVDFSFVLNQLKSMKNSPERKKEQALAVYLFWLKTAIEQNVIAIYFGIIDEHKCKISNYCNQSRTSLIKDFVPIYLGAKHLKREDWLLNNNKTVETLFKLSKLQFVFICDGTYCYCQKSFNNAIQRLLYSVQKSRHLVKPFIICAANGYIIDVYGPYPATLNDAQILDDILKNDKDFKSLIQVDDIAIVDRGFRNIIQKLNELGLIDKMPTCNFLY